MRRPSLPLLWLGLLALSACAPKEQPIEGLRTFTYLGGDQRGGSLSYLEHPPVGGPYNALWQSCGVYTGPLYNEYAVHTLARGAVWVTYRPGLPAEALAALRTLLAEQPAVLVSPYPGLPVPIVMTAWNRQISAERADDLRLARFLNEVVPENSVPEPGAGCANGYKGTR